MYLSLIITFLLLLVIIIGAVQNSLPLDLKFFTWSFQTSIAALILYSSVIGGAIVAVLSLPRLAKKSFAGRSMNKEINKLKDRVIKCEESPAVSSQESRTRLKGAGVVP
jgi:putative membrane protein